MMPISNDRIRKVKNLLRPSVYGVGFIGIGPYVAGKKNGKIKTYQVWSNMLQRVYRPSNKNVARQYAGTWVHPDWHNYQYFAAWYEKQINEFNSVSFRWCIDKDLKIPGNRQYGTETCFVVPEQINALLNDRFHARGKLPLGVSQTRNYYQARINNFGKPKTLGTYKTIREAQLSYWSAKFQIIQQTTIVYWQYIPESLAFRLLCFDWEDAFAYYGDDARLWSD